MVLLRQQESWQIHSKNSIVSRYIMTGKIRIKVTITIVVEVVAGAAAVVGGGDDFMSGNGGGVGWERLAALLDGESCTVLYKAGFCPSCHKHEK